MYYIFIKFHIVKLYEIILIDIKSHKFMYNNQKPISCIHLLQLTET